MSNVFDAIAWAIHVSKGEPMPARMLLIVGLAQRINNQREDMLVWPSINQICADTDMSRTSVKKWMRHLEDVGLVERFETTRADGGKGRNEYRLPVRATFYHPRKGEIESDHTPGRNPTVGGSIDATGVGSTARPCNEQQLEQQYEGIESAPDELDLGLPPVPPKDPVASDVADLIAEQWAARAFATPIRGGRPTEAAAEKAFDLAKKYLVEGQTVLDVWTEIFTRIDDSDFLQGKVAGRDDRPPFKLTLSFLLEKRNFEKTLEGRFNGRSTGATRRGSTSEATGRVIQRIRSGQSGSARGGNQELAIARG